MSMHRIAECLKWNGFLNGQAEEPARLAIPKQSFKVRYQLWQSESDRVELFEAQSTNRARNGLLSRFML